MQHYGLPTRLLDWSFSSLVALFFATEPADNQFDAAIWTLEPVGLNRRQISTQHNIAIATDSEIQSLFKDAFIDSPEPRDKRVAAVLTEQIDLRELVQQSAFTVHGSDVPLNKFPEADTYLAKIIIPKDRKRYFVESLDLLGITRSILFPDLGNLAIELTSRGFIDK